MYWEVALTEGSYRPLNTGYVRCSDDLLGIVDVL